MKQLLSLILLATLALLTGCSTDSGEPTDEIVSYDIVCLKSQDSKAGGVYTLQLPLASSPVTYYAKQLIDTTRIHVGDRLLIAYIAAGKPYESGNITLRGYSPITNSKLLLGSATDIEGYDRDPVYLLSAWLSGPYLNVKARLPYDESPRRYGVAVDTVALKARPACPELYLIHSLDEATDPGATFPRAYYASFDLTALLSDPRVETVTLHLNNSNLPDDIIVFETKQ